MRGQRRAVGPLDARGELPGDAAQVRGHAAVLDRRNLVDEHRHHVAVFVVVGERLDHQGRRLDVLGAARQVGIDGRRRLPVQDVQVAVAAALGVRGGRHHRRDGHRRDQAGLVEHFRFSPLVGSNGCCHGTDLDASVSRRKSYAFAYPLGRSMQPMDSRSCAVTSTPFGNCGVGRNAGLHHGNLSVETETQRWSDFANSHYSDIEPESDASLSPSQTCFCMVCGEVAPPDSSMREVGSSPLVAFRSLASSRCNAAVIRSFSRRPSRRRLRRGAGRSRRAA